MDLLKAIYADWRLVVNYFQPLRKLLAKEREGTRVGKKYDLAQTPYRRVLTSPDVAKGKKSELEKAYRTLNPVVLNKRIEENLRALGRLPR